MLQEPRRRKERTYPELNGAGGRARLVVLAAEVGGRWSDETAQFLEALAKHRAQGAPGVMGQRVQSAWLRRWGNLLGCNVAKAFALSLVVMRPQCMRWCAIVVLLEQGIFSVPFFFAPLDHHLIS